MSSANEAFNHQPRHQALELEYERWEKAVTHADGELHELKTFQPTMEILGHALESFNPGSVPGSEAYKDNAERYSEAYKELLRKDFAKCDEICKELQELKEDWAPTESQWFPVLFWKCCLIRSLAMPHLAHEKGNQGFHQNVEEHFRTIVSDNRHHRYILDPTILIRLLIDKNARASLISRGTTEKDLDEAGIVKTDAELEKIRFWYWNEPDRLVFAAPAA